MKPHIVLVGNNAALRDAAKRELTARGAPEWFSFSKENPWTILNKDHVAYHTNGYENLPTFDLTAVPMTKWLAFMDEPEKSLGQVAFEARWDAKPEEWDADGNEKWRAQWERCAQAVVAEHEKRKAGKLTTETAAHCATL